MKNKARRRNRDWKVCSFKLDERNCFSEKVTIVWISYENTWERTYLEGKGKYMFGMFDEEQ